MTFLVVVTGLQKLKQQERSEYRTATSKVTHAECGQPVNEPQAVVFFPMERGAHPAYFLITGRPVSSLKFPRRLFLAKQRCAATCVPNAHWRADRNS